MQRSLLSLSILSSLLSFFVVPACAPDASSKQPLAVCQEGDEGCPTVPRAEKKAPSPSRSTGPSGDPATPTTTNEEQLASADAGTPVVDAAAEAAPPLGSLCTALDACCDQIEEAGYIPDNCRSVVDLRHESACYAQHQQYKTAGDCS